MSFFTQLLVNFIANALTAQLEVFKTALLCFVGIGVPVFCCKLISGHFTIDLGITGRRNLIIFILYNKLKISAFTVFVGKQNIIFQNTGGELCLIKYLTYSQDPGVTNLTI